MKRLAAALVAGMRHIHLKALFIVLSMVVGLAATGMISTAHAVTVYTDRVLWEATVGSGFTTERFLNPIANAEVITLDNGIVSSFVGTGTLGFNRVNIDPGRTDWQGTVDGTGEQVILWELPYSVTAFGADLNGINDSPGADGLKITGNFNGTGDITLITLNGFLGIISDTPFDAFTFAAGSNFILFSEDFSIDTFSLGPEVAPVPLPAAFPLLGGALSLLGFFGWRRKRMAAA